MKQFKLWQCVIPINIHILSGYQGIYIFYTGEPLGIGYSDRHPVKKVGTKQRRGNARSMMIKLILKC